MPSALQFIGGGLLQGVGKGIVESGKAKRERVLADLEHTRRLERDEARFEANRGLLGTRIGAQEDAAELLSEQRIDASEVAAGVATTTATELSKRKVSAADLENERKVEAAKVKAKAAKPTDTTAAEDRIIGRHRKKDEFGNLTDDIDHEAAAVELENRGFKKAAAAQRRKGKGIADQDIRQRAEKFADEMVDEQAHPLVPDSVDFKDDGGSRTRFRARMVREFIAKNGGKGAVTPPTRPAAAKPEAPATVPYVGDAQPPDFPDARRADDGFWYVTRGGKTLRVQQPKAKRRRVR